MNQDLIGITVEDNKIKITGFKHNEILLKVYNIIERIKTYKFPDYWNNVINLIEGVENCMEIEIP